jgi:uncharacterized protein (DUF58 family)
MSVQAFDRILPANAKDALQHFELMARRKVEGFLHGVHVSRRIGVSTDFDHHKEYTPGDPLKHVDWKVSARHARYYVKRYTEDTALSVRLVVDRSASMRQETEELPSKYLVACEIAACLGYLVLKEGDSVGLTLSSRAKTVWIPPSSRSTHLVALLKALVNTPSEAEDSLEVPLKAMADRGERKGLVVVVSDLMFDPAPAQRELGKLQAQGHEILLFQVRDPTEEEFPFRRWVQFGDLEDASVRHRVDAVALKRVYLEEYQALLTEWERWAKKYDVHFVPLRTRDRVDSVLSTYLAHRSRLSHGR